MQLTVTPSPIAAEVLDVVDVDVPVGSGNVVGRANTKHEIVWATKGSPSAAKLRDVRAAVVAAGHPGAAKWPTR